MTEDLWLHGDNTIMMIDWLDSKLAGQQAGVIDPLLPCPIHISDRKLRLFAVACCRQIWDDLIFTPCFRCEDIRKEGCSICFASNRGDKLRNAVECAEAFADEKRHLPFIHAQADIMSTEGWIGAALSYPDTFRIIRRTIHNKYNQTPPRDIQASLLRCLIGNPYRKPYDYSHCGKCLTWFIPSTDRFYHCPKCDSDGPFTCAYTPYHWLTHNDSAVRRIAQVIYDERQWDDMPILADALRDAGCDNDDMLTHCQAPGVHARGCWVVDMILRK